MKYFYDTEFLENGETIKLISLGMICEDGREFYGESVEAPWYEIAEHRWLMDNVVPNLSDQARQLLPRAGGKRRTQPMGDWGPVMARDFIRHGVLDLIGNDPDPQLWAYYAAYDHVALAQLWGTMISLPDHMPKRTNDLAQRIADLGNPRVPEQTTKLHNALSDAKWNMETYFWLGEIGELREQ